MPSSDAGYGAFVPDYHDGKTIDFSNAPYTYSGHYACTADELRSFTLKDLPNYLTLNPPMTSHESQVKMMTIDIQKIAGQEGWLEQTLSAYAESDFDKYIRTCSPSGTWSGWQKMA